MTNRSSKRGHPDKYIFKDMTTFKPEHKASLLKHMKDLMLRINSDNITVEETKDRFDNFSQQLQNLIKYYTK